MKEKIDIKNWKTGNVIFSYECENNSIKKTVEEAVKQGISLAYADLAYRNLSEANLSFADLSYASLKDTNLANTNLSYADLSKTNLSEANLNYACLGCANLNSTNLTNANLFGVDFCYSDLSTAILDNVKGLNDQCPKEGSFIGWKKCYNPNIGPVIVKLEIPADARRSSSTGIKCRCDKAKVLEIQNMNGGETIIDIACSYFNEFFKYKIGEMRQVPDFDERYWIECTRGIHFFMNREDAVIFEF